MNIEVNGHSTRRAVALITNCHAQRAIGERHEKSALNDSTQIAVFFSTFDSEFDAPCTCSAVKRADERNKTVVLHL